MDNLVVEEDIGDLGRRYLRSRYCSCERTIPISNDDHKLVTGPSTWEQSEDVNDNKL